MDGRRAEEDTLDDVNICIFDYMLCKAIHTAINATGDNTGEWDVTWIEDTTQMLKSILPPSQMLPVAIRIKAQVLEMIKMLNSAVQIEPNALVEMASMFVSTCNVPGMEVVKRRAAEIAIQLKVACQTERMSEAGPTTLLHGLVDIMRMLEPPILLQLERGKLEGLGRAETQQLKQRIGLD